MAEPRRIGGRLGAFEDLEAVDDEVLRQVATRVHLIDLAYAFRRVDESLRDRLLASVRPGLAEQIRSAFRTVEEEDTRFASPESERMAQARVLEVARSVMLED